ncbi:MAG: hypothetical protein ACK6DY_21620, partial [Acidobacteriota bacterium]
MSAAESQNSSSVAPAPPHGAGTPPAVAPERGVPFGYHALVSDMRAQPILAEIGCPVVFDATHSVMQPGGQGDRSGGQR